MKKLIGILAIASMFTFVLTGCSQPPEGDPAPAPETGKVAPKTEAPTEPTK
ncbi:MAG: hypothetical protein H7Y17_15915 [Chlorobia bacterium]|nr:hypothetical protein [Fimbriimonadaceae bacterium]